MSVIQANHSLYVATYYLGRLGRPAVSSLSEAGHGNRQLPMVTY
jgi:hypothetical protein